MANGLDPRIPLGAVGNQNPLLSLAQGIQAGAGLAAQRQQNQIRQQQADLQTAAVKRQAMLAAAQGLRTLDSEQQRQAALPTIMRRLESDFGVSFNQDRLQQLGQLDLSNEGLDAFIAGMGGQSPGQMTIDQQLRAQEIQTKRGRLQFDREQAQREIEALNQTIDTLDVDEPTKKALKGLPAKSKASAVERIIDPARTQKRRENEAKNAQIKQEFQSFADTINAPNFEAAVGPVDSLLTSVTQLFGTEDAKLNKKINRQSKSFVIKMAKSLGANPTDRDMKILLESIPSTYSHAEDWYTWFNEEAVPIFNARAQAQGLDPIEVQVGPSEAVQVGRFKLRQK